MSPVRICYYLNGTMPTVAEAGLARLTLGDRLRSSEQLDTAH